MQIAMGTHPWVYWTATLAVDMVAYLSSVILAFIIFAIYQNEVILGFNGGAAVLLFIFYGLSAAAFWCAFLFASLVSDFF